MFFEKLNSFLKLLNDFVSDIMDSEIFDCKLTEEDSIV
jgi:hypothetical protein